VADRSAEGGHGDIHTYAVALDHDRIRLDKPQSTKTAKVVARRCVGDAREGEDQPPQARDVDATSPPEFCKQAACPEGNRPAVVPREPEKHCATERTNDSTSEFPHDLGIPNASQIETSRARLRHRPAMFRVIHPGEARCQHYYSAETMTDHTPNPSSSTSDGHIVSLTLPLHLRHASTARVVAASLAGDAGFSVDEIDDLRLGINEVVSVLADEPSLDPEARLVIEFNVTAGRVDATVTRTDGAGAAELDDLAQRILHAVTDRHEYARGAFKISKTAALRDDAD
jgi:hypothetical protein